MRILAASCAVKASPGQIPTPIQRPTVCHRGKPSVDRTLGRIEASTLLEQGEEDVGNEILSFIGIAKNSPTH